MKNYILLAVLIFMCVWSTGCKEDIPNDQIKDENIIAGLKKLSTQDDTIQIVEIIAQRLVKNIDMNEKIQLLDLGLVLTPNLVREHMLFSLEYLKTSFQSQKSPQILQSLNDLLNNQGREELALVMIHSLKTNFPKSNEAQSVVNESWKQITHASIQKRGLDIFDPLDSTKIIDTKTYLYIDLCESYAITHPNDLVAPSLLYQAGELARSLGSFEKSVSLYDSLERLFPQYSNTPMALFIKGFILDSNLGNKEAAKVSYDNFIKRYPNHERIKDAQFLLDNLYVSDEELLKGISKQ